MASKATSTSGSKRRNRPSPRQRLLASATHLFTTEGIRVIGIDRILREADVAKASLYSLFGSKDKLVIAYLEALDEKARETWATRTAGMTDVESKILAFFDIVIDEEPGKDFRGSHFLNAANEYPKPDTDSEAQIVDTCLAHRQWMHDTMTALLNEKNGYPSATQADQLLIFLDGGQAGARLLRDKSPLYTARDLARHMLNQPPADYSI
ncbi:TetR/AcrR family transcriptional regulator [Corynebacterium uterequi]|uniref:Transcriptional regulator, TetR family n=1 Tax=Corynebacterium uterequi TaxID=1072256 RepID=A0A0G3HH87_9CORY|nr:TetR/AcrR family transcriptional regulator [Corynebacterium uterequi]AKK12115.1 transcriptional regulator, TetR family [Corynebacterium uterequi]